MTEFAPPLSQLSESGIGVSVNPTTGFGIAAGPGGLLPLSALPMKFGTATLTWPGGTPFSTALTVTHSLNKLPTIRLVTIDGLGISGVSTWPVLVAYSAGDATTTMGVQGMTPDSSSPAAGSTVLFYWLVA